MKNLYIFLSLTLFLFLIHSLVNGQTIQPIERSVGKLHISIDPRMEILSIAQLLSNYPMINRTSPYSKDLMNHFKSYASHEAILMTDSLLRHGFTYDKPVAFMLYLSQPPELEQQIAFANYLMTESGGEDNLEKYRKSLQQFAKTSNFETFWNNKIPYYNQILDLAIVGMDGVDLVKILEDYFNETKDGHNIIISPSISAGGYAATVTDVDDKDITYACIASFNSMSVILLSLHEFSHPFVNPLTDKYSDRVESLNKLFEPVKENISQAYRTWQICVNEHIVRAVVIRLVELYFESQSSKFLLDEFQIESTGSKFLLENELRGGFIYIEPLIEKLKEFESQRDKNNVTFTEYYPELLNMLEGLQK